MREWWRASEVVDYLLYHGKSTSLCTVQYYVPAPCCCSTQRARARMVPGPPSTGVAIAMDGGMAGSLPDREGDRYHPLREMYSRGGTYQFGVPQHEHVSPPTYLSERLASAPPTPAFYRYKTAPRAGREPETWSIGRCLWRCAGCRARGGVRSDARGGACRCARHFTRAGQAPP